MAKVKPHHKHEHFTYMKYLAAGDAVIVHHLYESATSARRLCGRPLGIVDEDREVICMSEFAVQLGMATGQPTDLLDGVAPADLLCALCATAFIARESKQRA
jgi:hypothetical protein